MRTAHRCSLPLVAGAITIAGAVSSASVAPNTAGNPSVGSIEDARPQGRDAHRLLHSAPAIAPAQAKALAVNGFEQTAAGVHLHQRLHESDFTAAGVRFRTRRGNLDWHWRWAGATW